MVAAEPRGRFTAAGATRRSHAEIENARNLRAPGPTNPGRDEPTQIPACPLGDALIVYRDAAFARICLLPCFDGFSVAHVRNLVDARAALPTLDDLRLAVVDLDLDVARGAGRARASERGSRHAASSPPSPLLFVRELQRFAPDAVIATLTRGGVPGLTNRAQLLSTACLHPEGCQKNLRYLAQGVADGDSDTAPMSPRRFLSRVTAANPLTPRQAHIARQLLYGLTRAEIAVRLRIAEVTVKAHVRDILRACGAATTADLLRAYLRAADRASRDHGVFTP